MPCPIKCTFDGRERASVFLLLLFIRRGPLTHINMLSIMGATFSASILSTLMCSESTETAHACRCSKCDCTRRYRFDCTNRTNRIARACVRASHQRQRINSHGTAATMNGVICINSAAARNGSQPAEQDIAMPTQPSA